ncbi:MAG: heme-binding protein [Paracoccaceae bacterium]|nr:heme-binding protein [Paracoccaceae bacterium]MDG1739005.1 heme-binding protein [Paracoccaceae bacterium]MDG2257239.1 heme-binding protein [Paracoccaceae bacterium]
MAVLSLRKARTIIRKTLDYGKEQGYRPLSVVVLDEGGNVKAFEREDDAAPGRFAVAHGKAFGSIMLGIPGSVQKARAEEEAYLMQAINGVYGGQVVPVPGGILLRDKRGRIVGAMGVTGDTSENDAEAGLAGIEASGLIGEA